MGKLSSPPPGLCGRCSQAHRLESARGSVFWLCERHRVDPHFARYPRLPVLECRGFEAADKRLGAAEEDR